VRILAFDTATRATSVALVDDPQSLSAEARDDPEPGLRPRHTTRLMSLIVEVLDRAGTGWAEVERIAVGVGPGTFTGLRIGVATARALARAHAIPLMGVSTLESLALGASGPAGHGSAACAAERAEVLLAVLDARRKEVYAAAWPASRPAQGRWRPLLEPRAAAPEALAEATRQLGTTVMAVGDGAVEFRRVLEREGFAIPEDGSDLHRVSAINHCRLAGACADTGSGEVLPEYLRLPDAELTRRGEARR